MELFNKTFQSGEQAKKFNESGNKKYQLGQYEAAIEDYCQAIKLDQNNAVYWSNLGHARYNLNQYSEAIEAYCQAIKLDQNNAVYWSNLGNASYNLNQYSEAIEAYCQAIKLDQNNAVYWSNLGNARYDLNQYSEAIEAYCQAIKLDQNNAVYWSNLGNASYNLNQYSEAIEAYCQAIKLDQNNAVYWSNLGNARCNLNQYSEAIEAYCQAIKLDQNNAVYWSNLGNASYNLNQYSEAIEAYCQALSLDKNNKTFLEQRINAEWFAKKHEDVFNDCKNLIKLDPNNQVARQFCKKLLELYPNSAAIWLTLGDADSDLKNNQSAIENYSRAIELDKGNGNAARWEKLADLKYEVNQYEAAILDYEKALSLVKNDKNLLIKLIRAKWSAGRYQEVFNDCALFLASYPNEEVICKLALSSKKVAEFFESATKNLLKSRYERAIEGYSIVLQENPVDTFALIGRANAKLRLGRANAELRSKYYEGAIDDCSKALKINPNDTNAVDCSRTAKFYLEDYQGKLFKAVKELDKKKIDEILDQYPEIVNYVDEHYKHPIDYVWNKISLLSTSTFIDFSHFQQTCVAFDIFDRLQSARTAPFDFGERLRDFLDEAKKSYIGTYENSAQDKKLLDKMVGLLIGKEIAPLFKSYTLKFWGHLLSLDGRIAKKPAKELKEIENMNELEEQAKKLEEISIRLTGFHEENFLPMRIRILFEVILKLEKNISLGLPLPKSMDSNNFENPESINATHCKVKLINLLMQCIETYRLVKDTSNLKRFIGHLRETYLVAKGVTSNLLDSEKSYANDNSLVTKKINENYVNVVYETIKRREVGDTLQLASGWKGHTIYVRFKKLAENGLKISIDNLGESRDNHVKEENRNSYYPYVIELESYQKDDGKELRNFIFWLLILKSTERYSDQDNFFQELDTLRNWIYEAKSFNPNRIKIIKDFSSIKNEEKNKKCQRVGNCVVKNHQYFLELMLGKDLYKWYRKIEIALLPLKYGQSDIEYLNGLSQNSLERIESSSESDKELLEAMKKVKIFCEVSNDVIKETQKIKNRQYQNNIHKILNQTQREIDNGNHQKAKETMKDFYHELEKLIAIANHQNKRIEKNILTVKDYWYPSEVVQKILEEKIKVTTILKQKKDHEFLCVGDSNQGGTLSCERYPNERFYVAIAHVTDVGCEQQYDFGNNEVSRGIDFASLVGRSEQTVVTSVCKSLLSNTQLTSQTVPQWCNQFIHQCQLLNKGTTLPQIEKMDSYKDLKNCKTVTEAKELLEKLIKQDYQKTVFTEVLPLILKPTALTPNARIIVPLNKNNNHWVSLELVLRYNTQKGLNVEVLQHDPYGQGKLTLEEQNSLTRKLTDCLDSELKNITKSKIPVVIQYVESAYQKRQKDQSSCGAITIEDIFLLAQGKTLDNRLFLEGAPKLRQQHQQVYNQTIPNNNTPTQKPRPESQKPPLPKMPIKTPNKVEEKIENEKESREQFSSMLEGSNLVKNPTKRAEVPVKQNPSPQKKNNDEKVLNLN